MLRWVLFLTLAGGLAGCIVDDEFSAEEVAIRESATQFLAQVLDARYGDAWASMHPAHQAVVSRERLVDCGERFPPAFVSFEIIDVETDEYLAGEIGTVDARLVDVRFEVSDEFRAVSGTTGEIDRSFNYVLHGDDWRWFLGTGELDVFRAGNCGLPWPGGS